MIPLSALPRKALNRVRGTWQQVRFRVGVPRGAPVRASPAGRRRRRGCARAKSSCWNAAAAATPRACFPSSRRCWGSSITTSDGSRSTPASESSSAPGSTTSRRSDRTGGSTISSRSTSAATAARRREWSARTITTCAPIGSSRPCRANERRDWSLVMSCCSRGSGDLVDAYVREHWGDAMVLGIHYRGTDKSAEAPRVPYEEVEAAVRQAISRAGPRPVQAVCRHRRTSLSRLHARPVPGTTALPRDVPLDATAGRSTSSTPTAITRRVKTRCSTACCCRARTP